MDNDRYDNIVIEIEQAIADLTSARDQLQADPTLVDDDGFLESVENATHSVAHITEW